VQHTAKHRTLQHSVGWAAVTSHCRVSKVGVFCLAVPSVSAAKMAKSSMELLQNSPRRDFDRPLSRSYLPRFKRDRYNFDTSTARNSVNDWQRTKVAQFPSFFISHPHPPRSLSVAAGTFLSIPTNSADVPHLCGGSGCFGKG
jgi:hypothetical protein